jgi:hypothetical protein
MRVEVAKSAATALLEQLQRIDSGGLDTVGDAGEVHGTPDVQVIDSPARMTAPVLQEGLSRQQPAVREEPTLGVKVREAMGDFCAIAFVLMLALIAIPIQLPFLLLPNVRRYRHCKEHDLLFRPLWPSVPLPARRLATIGALKICVYSDDHPPPHFHVVTDKYNAKFTIASCDLLGVKSDYVSRHERAIKGWHARNTRLQAAAWATTRPSTASPQ